MTNWIQPSKHDWSQYFRIEPYHKQSKGTVFRVRRLRDNVVVLRLVKSQVRVMRSIELMLEDEVKAVEKLVEKALLG